MTQVIIFSGETSNDLELLGRDEKTHSVKLSDLEASLDEIGPAIKSVVTKITGHAKDLGLTEISLSVGINGSGKVGFLGTGTEIGGEATISLKFKV